MRQDIIHSNDGNGDRPRVVVIGTGHGGMEAVHGLRNAPVDVTLIDRNNYHKFQPLLYQVATAGLSSGDITQSARHIFNGQKNFSFRLGRVQSIDFEQQRVHVMRGQSIPYDYLVLAAGASTAYFGVPGAEEHTLPLKNVADAINLRSHILDCFERADADPFQMEEGALSFVIIGGGPTGVELAGSLSELFDRVLRKDFSGIDIDRASITLIEMADHLLLPYKQSLRDYTARVLTRRGVDVRLGVSVVRIEPGKVHLSTGDVLRAHTVIWAAGVRANPLADALDVEQGPAGRVVVDEHLRVPGFDNVFVVGDMADARTPEGDLYPQLAQVAIQQGRHAARQISADLRGDGLSPFTYRDHGMMATIGRNAAVVQFSGGRTLRGAPAWLAWVFVHVLKLVGFRNRISVLMNWTYNYFTWDRGPRILLSSVPERDELDAPIPHPDAVTAPQPQEDYLTESMRSTE